MTTRARSREPVHGQGRGFSRRPGRYINRARVRPSEHIRFVHAGRDNLIVHCPRRLSATATVRPVRIATSVIGSCLVREKEDRRENCDNVRHGCYRLLFGECFVYTNSWSAVWLVRVRSGANRAKGVVTTFIDTDRSRIRPEERLLRAWWPFRYREVFGLF